MKLVLTLLALCAFSLHAADTIVLHDNGTLTINGVSANNASDALLNRQVSSADFMAALKARLDDANAATSKAQADVTALQGKMQAQLQGDLSSFQEALKTATNDTQKAVLAGQIALIQGYLPEAIKSPDQLKVEALAEEIAAKQAELAKLQADQASK